MATQKRTLNGTFSAKGEVYTIVFSFFPQKENAGGWYARNNSSDMINLNPGTKEVIKTEDQAFAWLRKRLSVIFKCKEHEIRLEGEFRNTSY